MKARTAQANQIRGLLGKRGDSYVRTLLIHGARLVLRQVERRPERADRWLRELPARRPENVVAVALANKNARIANRARLPRSHSFSNRYSARRELDDEHLERPDPAL